MICSRIEGLMVLLLMKKNKGFTLLEMMVVIAITAIVSAIAIPNFISVATGMKIRSASRDLCSTLRQARMNAIRTNTRWAVQFNVADAPPPNYIVIDCGPNNTCGDGDDVKKLLTPIPPGVTMNLNNFVGNQVIFNTDGTSPPGFDPNINNTTTTLTNTKGTSNVVVATTGRITIPP
jgi:prepilin-type N-terminal cleavage/methylation domain-containing protein